MVFTQEPSHARSNRSWCTPPGRRFAALVLALAVTGGALASGGARAQNSSASPAANSSAGKLAQWPKDVTTRHVVTIGGKPVSFSATAGYITLRNAQTRKPIADIAYIAFTRDGQDKAQRPVTFAFNGGPGYASAWLNLGAMGPWRLNMAGAGVYPSARPVLIDNQESWLPFTDMVFIDPAGTGYGRLHDKDAGKFLWSVNGDISSLATTIRRWVENNGRTASPKYLLGESYGGFRAPKIAHDLQTKQGIGVNGMVLVSPVLDFTRRRYGGALSHAGLLPSLAATAMGVQAQATGGAPVKHQDMAGVEAYARGDYLVDLVKGRSNGVAVKRIIQRVTQLTGLDRSLVASKAGRISMSVFTREFYRGKGKVASMYDGLVEGLDPDRFATSNESEDQMRLGLHAPITQAMSGLYRDRLKWVYPDGRYMFQNEQAGTSWKWGRRPPEAVSELASTIALDPKMKVLVVHGLTDLVTPYFETRLVLDDMAPIGGTDRIRFKVYNGGHMFYSQDGSRKAFRDDGRAMIAAGNEGKG